MKHHPKNQGTEDSTVAGEELRSTGNPSVQEGPDKITYIRCALCGRAVLEEETQEYGCVNLCDTCVYHS